MRVLFVVPPKAHPRLHTLRDEICFQDVYYNPFPLRFAATAPLLRDFADVSILDANGMDWGWEKLEAEMPEADLIVYKSAAGLVLKDYEVARIARRKFGASVKIALVETTAAPIYPDRVMADFPEIDFIIRGQIEAVVPELARRMEQPDSVAGLAYRKDGGCVPTEAAKPLNDLNTLPFQAYDLLPMKRYTMSYLAAPRYEKIVPGIRMRTTRDCPYLCPFCIIGTSVYRGYDLKWRSMTPERVVAELEHVRSTYGISNIYFWDETFTLDQKRAMRLCEMLIERRLDILWRCLTRMDCVSPQLLEKMADAGCRHIEYGLEAGDPDSRAAHHKKFGNDVVKRVVAATQAEGIAAHVDVIVGMPWDDHRTLDQTLHLVNDIKADNLHLTMAFPYPETEFYREAQARNLLQVDDMYRYMVGERVRVGAKPYVRSEALSADELYAAWRSIRRRSDRHFFIHQVLLNPKTLWRYARLCVRPPDLAQIARRAVRSVRHFKPIPAAHS